jgi:hypothetical protein
MIVEPDDSLAHIGRWRDPQGRRAPTASLATNFLSVWS